MARGVDQVDKILLVDVLLARVGDVILVIHGHTGRFDGDASFLLVFSSIGVSFFSGVLG